MSQSQPYPHDRARARKEDGEQPFKDAKESLAQNEAQVERDALGRDGFDRTESPEERHARQEAEARDRLAEIGDDVAEERNESS